MEVTILGASASYAGAGQACAGHLVRGGGVAVMLDCGNGTVANASAVIDVTSLDRVLVSHTHADHFLDLYALQAALRFAPSGPVGRLPLCLPEGLWERMGALLPETGRAHLAEAFDASVLVPGEPIELGGMRITAHGVEHDGPSYGFLVETDGARLIYTSDTRDCDPARALASLGCDVLMAECTLPTEFAGRAPHLTPAEAAGLATLAGAHTLVLTHLWPTVDHERLLAEARDAFEGNVLLARELLTIPIAPGGPGLDKEGI